MNRLNKMTTCLLLAPLCLFACGGGGGGGGGGSDSKGNGGDSSSLERALIQSYLAPYDLRSIGEESIHFAARFVFLASFSNGRTLTASGTLTQSSPNSDDFAYDPTPQDHLRVQFADAAKTTVELFVVGFDGDFGDFDAEDFNLFLDFHRDLRFRLKNATLDVGVQSQSGNTDDVTRVFEWAYEGTLTRTDDTIRLQAHDQGQDQSVFDPPFSNRRKEDNITGLFASSLGETSVDARLTFANDFSQEGSDFSTNEDFLKATTVRSEDEIRLENGRVKLSFVNDRPGEVREVEGTFSRGSDTIASLEIIDDADGRPLVVVVLEDGRVIQP
ncbi:MAG: hypothetical protein U1E76_01410 [Planctomycetota bacterium]